MKSDREFIDGIYAKAEAAKTKSVEEVQKIENTGRNSGRRIFNISAAVTAAAAVLAIFLTSAYILKITAAIRTAVTGKAKSMKKRCRRN